MSAPRRIFVTGAGSGLGLGAALGLAAAGHDVVAAAETWQQVRAVRAAAQTAGVGVRAVKLDLLDPVDMAHAATFTVDVLVLHAGVIETGSVLDLPLGRLRRSLEVNVVAHVDLVQRLVPAMVARGSGRVVWTSSVGAFVPLPFGGAYAATKRAVEALAASMRAELTPHGISVATIAPGPYSTGFNESGLEAMMQWYDPTAAVVALPEGVVVPDQGDPQEMVDAMVTAIPDDDAPYRTMVPREAVDAAQQAQRHEWNA